MLCFCVCGNPPTNNSHWQTQQQRKLPPPKQPQQQQQTATRKCGVLFLCCCLLTSQSQTTSVCVCLCVCVFVFVQTDAAALSPPPASSVLARLLALAVPRCGCSFSKESLCSLWLLWWCWGGKGFLGEERSRLRGVERKVEIERGSGSSTHIRTNTQAHTCVMYLGCCFVCVCVCVSLSLSLPPHFLLAELVPFSTTQRGCTLPMRLVCGGATSRLHAQVPVVAIVTRTLLLLVTAICLAGCTAPKELRSMAVASAAAAAAAGPANAILPLQPEGMMIYPTGVASALSSVNPCKDTIAACS